LIASSEVCQSDQTISTTMFTHLISPERRRALHKLDRQWQGRLNTRIASTTFTLLSLIAFSASIPTWSAHFIHDSGPIRGDWTDSVPLIPLSLILCVDVFVLSHTIRLCHPPAARPMTIVESLILLLLTPALTLSVIGSLFIHFSAAIPENNGSIACSALQNYLSRECSPVLYTVGSLQLLGVVFGCIVWILHVSLTLWGAWDVRRNRQVLAKESTLERRRRRWREERSTRGRPRRREFKETGQRTGTGAYETYGWYR
jgi:hypothetical protein